MTFHHGCVSPWSAFSYGPLGLWLWPFSSQRVKRRPERVAGPNDGTISPVSFSEAVAFHVATCDEGSASLQDCLCYNIEGAGSMKYGRKDWYRPHGGTTVHAFL